MQNATPIFFPITKIEDENENVKTFYIQGNFKALPGQFVMLWLPGIDQKPFSISDCDDGMIALTIFKRGPLTENLFTMKVGDQVGITGPFGTSFSQKNDTHYMMVAGGYGAAPLYFLAKQLAKTNSTVDFFLGARDTNHLLFLDKIKTLTNTNLIIATDDGSAGSKGFVTEELNNYLQKDTNKQNILLCTCGPEMMEKKVLTAANEYDVDAEISIERFMKCGFGVCGQCCVDPIGLCMCTDGPVVNKIIANQITEFGLYHRDKSGAKINY